ncbi:MAG: restriction endonuclease subunit S [Arcobacteraceae bacterium]
MSEMMRVPDGWEVIQLGDVGSFKNGVNKSKEDFGFGMPFINLQDVFGHWEIEQSDFDLVNATDVELKNYNLNKGDILFIRSSVKPSGVGLTSVVKENIHNTIYSGFIIRFRSNDMTFDVEYSKYCFHDELFRQRLLQKSTVSANSNINQESLVSLDLLLPPKKEQEKIAKILSTLDKSIEATNRLIEKEKNIKTALMQELLTNGIDQNGQIRSIATHTYKKSELGLIPDEWEVVSLEKIGNVITGNTPSTDNEDYYNGNIPFIGPVDFVGQKHITKTEKTVSKDGLNYSREIPKDSILTVCIGSTIGKIALAVKQCCTNQQINALVCDKKYFSEFIFYAMSQFLQRQLNVEAGLQAVPIVNKSSFAKLVLPCPLDMEEQKQIAKILTTQDKKIETEQTNLAKLKELKKGLMNDLLSGKVRVKV